MKFLLSVIALCLVMITAKLYIPEAQAADMSTGKVLRIVENRCRVDHTKIMQMMKDGSDDNRNYYKISIIC